MKLCNLFEQGDEQRILEIAELLGEKTFHFGKEITDREAWEDLKTKIDADFYIKNAEQALTEVAVSIPDEIYLQYSTIGQRTEHDQLLKKQVSNIKNLCIAECLENSGRFIAKYEECIIALCSDRSWTINAHDPSLDTFNGKDNYIDLHIATSTLSFIHCDILLGDLVSKEVRTLLRDNINKRMLQPYLQALRGERPAYNWMTVKSNWNSVCLSSCMGTVLAMAEDPIDRAMAVVAFLTMGKYGMDCYKSDGYAIEEVGYWGYGYSHFIVGMELIRRSTNNKIDMQQDPLFMEVGLFGLRSRVCDGIVATVADCGFGVEPSPINNLYIRKRLALDNIEGISNYDVGLSGDNFYLSLMYWFWDAPVLPNASNVDIGDGLRNYFNSVQVLIARSDKNKDIRLGLYAKGGTNHECHNHLDIGSFVAMVNGETLIADCGCPPYDATTFSRARYENTAINSYGHSVPAVGGFGQKGNRFHGDEEPEIEYYAEVLDTNFTDEKDSITYDISKAYTLPFINSLTRNFVFDRSGNGSISVTDTFDFKDEQTFEVAFTTLSKVTIEDKTIIITGEKTGVKIDFSSTDIKFNIDTITACKTAYTNKMFSPLRISAQFVKPLKNGTLTSTVTPFVL